MKKLLFTVAVLLVSATLTFAQEQPVSPNPKVLPMFGNLPRTEEQQLKDQKFLSNCDANFANRQEASKFFLARGWEYFNEGKTDTAMYRFNLSWLLNPDNSNTHWAFGLVTFGKGKFEESVTYYEKALAIDPKNSLLLSDLATSYMAIYKQEEKRGKKKKALKKVAEFTNKAIEADSANAFALFSMSQVKFYEKRYEDAWNYLHQSRELNLTTIDFTYLAELMAQMPDPKGLFKNN